MKTIRYISKWFLVLALVGCAALWTGCSNDYDEPIVTPSITLAGKGVVRYNTTARFLQIKAIGEWNIAIEYNVETESPWCTIDPMSGTGDKYNAIMNLTDNTGEESRTARLMLTADGITTTTVIEQFDESYTDTPPEIPTVKNVIKFEGTAPTWVELPDITPQFQIGQSAVVMHVNTIDGKLVRNYSMLYDTVKYTAYWVAYPLYAAAIGGLDRTDKWVYDPMIPGQYQINVTEKSYPVKAAPGPYDRGHQLPSKDRTANAVENAQTFFVSNQTPQVASFNQGLWGRLEDKVRSYVTTDTLYVVTGAYFGEGYFTTPDNSGKPIPIPTHYYKVITKIKSGMTYKSIGFWFENRKYNSPENVLSIKYAKSVKDIETLTGLKFFPTLPTSVKEELNGGDWGL